MEILTKSEIPLHTANLRIEWDTTNKKEIEDAKKYYQRARAEKRTITTIEDIPVTCFNPNLGTLLIKNTELKETEFEMRIFDETGDRRLIWDSTDTDMIKDAAKMFKEYIKKGWRAYAIGFKGRPNKRVYDFDPEAEELFFDESGSIKEKLSKFIESFKEIKVIPKTRPGR
jgi:hypothetical protein